MAVVTPVSSTKTCPLGSRFFAFLRNERPFVGTSGRSRSLACEFLLFKVRSSRRTANPKSSGCPHGST